LGVREQGSKRARERERERERGREGEREGYPPGWRSALSRLRFGEQF